MEMSSPICVQTRFWTLTDGALLHITYHLINEQGIIVLTTGSPPERRQPGLYRASVTIPGDLLNSGHYSLKLLIGLNENRPIYEHEAIATFTLVDAQERASAVLSREPGVVQPRLKWETT
jgi:hypothetical protein